MPATEIPFLDPDFVRQACTDVFLSAEVAEQAADGCPRIASRAPLRALAWHYHHCLFSADGYGLDAVRAWPSLEGALEDDAGAFHLIVLLSGLPKVKAIHDAHRVPQEVVRDTFLDIALWVNNATQHRPGPGLRLNAYNIAWLTNHLRGILYRLGRLQFQFSDFWHSVRAFRHGGSGVVLALAPDGVRYGRDGQCVRKDADAGADGVWTSRLDMTADRITGHPILPAGRAVPKQVSLPAAEWRQALGRDDPVLNLHIPGGSPLDYGECGESLRRALEFFPRHFPERCFVAFTCGSWVLDGQLEELLPPTSNMVRFQREVYLFPIGLSPQNLVRQAFDGVPEDLAAAPRNTTLQRAVLDHLAAGKEMSPVGGGCFLLPEDFRWGTEVYRRQRLDPLLA